MDVWKMSSELFWKCSEKVLGSFWLRSRGIWRTVDYVQGYFWGDLGRLGESFGLGFLSDTI